MASRRRSRQYALQALYRSDVTATPVTAALQLLWSGLAEGEGLDADEHLPESAEIEFAQRLALGVESHRGEIDTLIEACSINWRIPRMPAVDRNILRIAAFELMRCHDIPPTVSINEAVELAKRYGSEDSRAFVNGIVDRMARQLERIDGSRKTKEADA
jgi:N utilization substance protein B